MIVLFGLDFFSAEHGRSMVKDEKKASSTEDSKGKIHVPE